MCAVRRMLAEVLHDSEFLTGHSSSDMHTNVVPLFPAAPVSWPLVDPFCAAHFVLPAFQPSNPMPSVCKHWQHFQLEPRTQSVFLNRKRRKAFPFLDAESPGATARGMVCGLPAPEAPCADRLCL